MDVNKIQSVYGIQNTSKVNKSTSLNAPVHSMGKDKVKLTETAADYTLAKNSLDNTPDIRQDLVNEIKSKIDNGTYEYDIDSLIDKILERAQL